MRHNHRSLSRLLEYVGLHPLPQRGRRVIVGVDAVVAVDHAQRGAALEEQDIAVAGRAVHAVLIAVDTDERGPVRHQVHGFLDRPPLVIAQAVGPFAAGDFVVVGGTEPIELRRVHGVAIRIQHRSIHAAVAADIGVAVRVAHQEVVGLAASRHRVPRPPGPALSRFRQRGILERCAGRTVALWQRGQVNVIVQRVRLVGGKIRGRAPIARIGHKKRARRIHGQRSVLRIVPRAHGELRGQRPGIAAEPGRIKMIDLVGLGVGPMAKDHP